MKVNYEKVWKSMNELELTTSKICSVREIIDSVLSALEQHHYDKAEALIQAADEFLVYYLEDFDKKFKEAWNETVVKIKKQNNIDRGWESFYYPEVQYTEEELNQMCDNAEKQEKKLSIEGKTLSYSEAIAQGWKMTGEGIWYKEVPSENG